MNADTDLPHGPLQGIRVIDLTIIALGPIATQIFGDMGADIIKVEQPGGDPIRQMAPARSRNMGAFFLTMNRNKRSIVLDLKRERCRAALRRLVQGADVFIHNMRHDAVRRIGFDYAAVSALNPRIVFARASGFRRGSSRDRFPAFDDVIQGLSGIAFLSVPRDGVPRYSPMVMVDKFCGYQLATGVTMALFRRERMGIGQELHVPKLETMIAFLMLDHQWGAVFDPVSGPVGYQRVFSRRHAPFKTSDGHVCMVALTDAQWRRVFEALERPDLATDPRFMRLEDRTRNVDVLYGELSRMLATRSTRHWLMRFEAADIPRGRLYSLEDLLEDSYLGETQFFQRIVHPTEGLLRLPGIATAFSATPGSIRCPPPTLSENGREILAEAGLQEDEIEAVLGATDTDADVSK